MLNHDRNIPRLGCSGITDLLTLLVLSQVPPSLKVSQIRVRSGELIDLLEFVMADGTIKDGGYRSDGGELQPAFDLEPDEHVVGIEAKMTSDSLRLAGLRIITSKGREAGWNSEMIVALREFSGSAQNPIVGFERGSTGFCPNIHGIQLLKQSFGGGPYANAAFEATLPRSEEQPAPVHTQPISPPVGDGSMITLLPGSFVETWPAKEPPGAVAEDAVGDAPTDPDAADPALSEVSLRSLGPESPDLHGNLFSDSP
jgi:hypothetical protein